jgi:hypothetical protein
LLTDSWVLFINPEIFPTMSYELSQALDVKYHMFCQMWRLELINGYFI